MKAALPKHLCDIEASELIWGPPPVILHETDFRPYQTWMSDKIVELPGVFLGAEMGLGKTAACLHAARRLLDAGEIDRVLVIAPLRVAEETWPEEIAKWSFARDLTYRVITGDEPQRRAAMRQPAQITIVNRENLLWLLKGLGASRWHFDMVIYDEASRLKKGVLWSNPRPNSKGETAKPRRTELGCLNRVRHRIKKTVMLSGTPSPNGLIDLYGPIFAIDAGERLGSSVSAFKARWFRENVYNRTFEPFDHSEAEIMGKIGDVFFSLREEDYLKLPPLVERDHFVELPKKAQKLYDQFEREAAIEVRNRAGEPEVVEAVNSGVLTQKLLQIANGSVYLGDKFDPDTEQKMPKESAKVHEEKLAVLESIMEEAAGKPVLVAYSFQFDKEAIRKRFPYLRVFGESKSDKRDWDAGKIRMLLTHPASAGHGLNFQHASNIAVWYGLTWSLELYRQFLKRLHRSGQTEDRVFLHRIIARNTADEDVLGVLRRRGATQDRITDAVRVRLGMTR